MLLAVRLPGGALAIRQPWRMACAWLTAISATSPPLPRSIGGAVDERTWGRLPPLADAGLELALTTSMGRLFDAVSALCGVRAEVSYEGQAAVELEAACDPGGARAATRSRWTCRGHAGDRSPRGDRGGRGGCRRRRRGGGDRRAVSTRRWPTPPCEPAPRRRSLAAPTWSCCPAACLQNRRLLEATAKPAWRSQGLRVLIPERLPVNDGGISYGQAAVAARRMAG